MSSTKYVQGSGTRIYVAPANCQRVVPPDLIITVDTGGALAGAESIPVDIAATDFVDPIVAPFWLNFETATGFSYFVKVVGDLDPTDTALVVAPLKKAIPANAEAVFPVLLLNRNTANMQDNDTRTDVMAFDNDGWQDSVITKLGNTLDAGGYYSPLDAGYNICLNARLTKGEIFWRLELPPPGCYNEYQKGHIFSGFANVNMPIESPADGVISSNITMSSLGPVSVVDPV